LIRREARVKLAGVPDLRIAKSRVGCHQPLPNEGPPREYPQTIVMSVIIVIEEVAYLRGFLDDDEHDDGVTVREYTINLPPCR
jgi:hypothetical protein